MVMAWGRKESDPAYRTAKEKGGNFGGIRKKRIAVYQYK
jgi:hypothetical protein